MQIFAFGTAVFAIMAAMALTVPHRALQAAIVLTSFGMFAAFRLPIGNLTPLLSHAAAGMATAVIAVVALRRAVEGQPLRLPGGGAALVLLVVWAIVATIILPRVFMGSIEVFSWAREANGERVDPRFPAVLSFLSPGTSNLSQTAYLCLSVGFFFVLAGSLRLHGVATIIAALRWAAIANVCLAVLSIVAPGMLAAIKTADYALLDHHSVAGFARVIGGFPEASVFGAHSATLAAFFLAMGTGRDLIIGAVSAVLAVASLSSTGLIGLAVAVMALSVAFVFSRFAYRVLHVTVSVLFLGLAIALAALPALDWSETNQILDRLLFSKAETASGLERGAMMLNGFAVSWESYGLGVGLGSTRASGFPSALLAALGIPGVILFVAFLVGAFAGRRHSVSGVQHYRRAATCAAITSISAATVSSFSVDPGLLFMAFAALASVPAHALDSQTVWGSPGVDASTSS